MSEANGSADLAPPERLHPLMLLSGIGGSIRGVAGGYAGIGYLAATGRLQTALVLAALLLAGALVSLFVYWRHFTYRVGADEIRIDSGFLSRTHRSIPFDRVQDVDISQGLLQRLLGLATVTFDTGASAGNKEEGALNGIALARAERLREHVRARRGAEVVAAREADQEPLFAMDLRRVLTAGVFNFSLAIFAGLFGLSQTLGDLIGFDPFERRFWVDLLASAGPVASLAQGHRYAAALAGLVLLTSVGLATGIFRTLARDFRFRLDRTGTGLRRRRGLFTLTDVTIPIRRVQAALIATGPVRSRFGWRQVKLQSLAQDEGGRGDHQVAPLATEWEAGRILAELGWSAPETPLEPFAPAYLWSLLAFLGPVAVIGVVGVIVLPPVGLVVLAVVAASALDRWLSWRRGGFAVDEAMLLIRRGWCRQRTVLVPLGSIQSIDLAENLLTRRLGVAALTLGVAGGRGHAGLTIPALPREKASQLRTALLSRFL